MVQLYEMSTFKRGDVWWYEFVFGGQRIRETAKTKSKTVAQAAERARRREMEEGFNHIPKKQQVPLIKIAGQRWLDSKTGLAAKSMRGYRQRMVPVLKEFGARLVSDISLTDLAAYQRRRTAEGASARTVNYELGCLRGILKHYGLWAVLADRVKHLKESHDVGKAVSADDEAKLIAACEVSHAPALLPLFILSIDSGLRSSEVKALRRNDLVLDWADGRITHGELRVPKSKTEAGTGRSVPLSARSCNVLTDWLGRFSAAGSTSFVFPLHRVGFSGNKGTTGMWGIDLERPVGEWKRAWAKANTTAGVHYRWHDLRHTFVSRLAENAQISEGTIRALAGHVSSQMLQRYSHIRTQAKRAAIKLLEEHHQPKVEADVKAESAVH